jgi:hypothetical protein
MRGFERFYINQFRRDTLIVCSVYFFVEKRICCFEGSFVDLLKLVEFYCGKLINHGLLVVINCFGC